MIKRSPIFDLKQLYPIFFQCGIIIALLTIIVLTKVQLPEFSVRKTLEIESEEIALILPPQISEVKTITAPPKPKVPIKIPDDSPIDIPEITFNEFDRTSRLMIPPLPNELKVKPDFELLAEFEVLPELIGGEDVLRQSITYPEAALRAGIEGIVEVEFMVNERGQVINPVITRGIGGGCDKVVLKAISLMRYEPGKKNGATAAFKIKETVQFIIL